MGLIRSVDRSPVRIRLEKITYALNAPEASSLIVISKAANVLRPLFLGKNVVSLLLIQSRTEELVILLAWIGQRILFVYNS